MSPEVEKVTYADETVWINRAQTRGFRGVPEAVWTFHIGGYPVREKWLKDRKGRTLSDEDIEHYQRVVVALNETIRIMGEIDEAIEEHGGWPIQRGQRMKTDKRMGTRRDPFIRCYPLLRTEQRIESGCPETGHGVVELH